MSETEGSPNGGSDNGRVRAEVAFDNRRRHRQVGRAAHEVLHRVAELHRAVTREEIVELVRVELARKPIDAPKKLSRPLSHIRTHVVPGVALLPPLAWRVTDIELTVPSGSRVDQVYESEEPIIIGDRIGEVIGVEIKLSASQDTAELTNTRQQVAAHLDGLSGLYGDRLLGVITLCLGQADSSNLTFTDRSVAPLMGTPLCSFPDGRLSD